MEVEATHKKLPSKEEVIAKTKILQHMREFKSNVEIYKDSYVKKTNEKSMKSGKSLQ